MSMFSNQSTTESKTQVFAIPGADATGPGLDLDLGDEGTVELMIARGPNAGERFKLKASEITLGRDPNCEVFLNDRTVSRRHAHMSIHDGVITIEDLGSLNGTWVDGAIVSHTELHHGSHVQIGTFQLLLNLH